MNGPVGTYYVPKTFVILLASLLLKKTEEVVAVFSETFEFNYIIAFHS